MHPRLGPKPGAALPAFQGEERQQIKWIAFAASVVGVVFVIAMVALVRLPRGVVDHGGPAVVVRTS